MRTVALGNAMRTAAEQYRADAATARLAKQPRTAEVFDAMARDCAWLAAELEPESGDVTLHLPRDSDRRGDPVRSVEREARRG